MNSRNNRRASSMRASLLLCASCMLFTSAGWADPNAVEVFPFPQPIQYTHHNDDYTVRVRVPGGAWQDLYEYSVAVDLDNPGARASMAYFNFDGTVEVMVQKNQGHFSSVAIRPTSRGIKTTVKDGAVYFKLSRPENLSIEFDQDRLHNLHLFTHAIRKNLPAEVKHATSSNEVGKGQDPDLNKPFVYFGPGVYKGEYHLKSNTTVYVDGSAVIQGPFIMDGVENVRILSDGLFDTAGDWQIKNSHNIVIDGPIFFNQVHGTMRCSNSTDLEENSIRTIGAGQWSDGLGHFACLRVTIDDSFIRTSDDCITLYNHRWNIWGDSRDFLVKNTTLWADVAHALMIGIHGNTPSAEHPTPEVIENGVFRNIDVLEHDEDDPDYQGAIGLMVGDDNLVRNLRFENWRIERIEEGKLFSLRVLFNKKYNTSPGRGIENIVLKDIAFSGLGATNPSLIVGFDKDRSVRNITLDNVTVAGKKITSPQKGILEIGPNVEGVTYK